MFNFMLTKEFTYLMVGVYFLLASAGIIVSAIASMAIWCIKPIRNRVMKRILNVYMEVVNESTGPLVKWASELETNILHQFDDED